MKPSFQRTPNKQHITKIVNEWQPHRFDDPVVIICSDGTHLLDDGQHRVEAAAVKLGEDAEILCRIGYSDTPGLEFVALNSTRRLVTAYWKHTAHLSDGEDIAVGVTAMANNHGLNITKGNTPRTISAVNTVTNLYQRDQLALDRTLYVLANVIENREDEVGWLKANVIQGVWYVIHSYDCDDKLMIRGLSKITPERAAPYSANDTSRNASDIIIAYNKGQRDNRRINIAQPREVEY